MGVLALSAGVATRKGPSTESQKWPLVGEALCAGPLLSPGFHFMVSSAALSRAECGHRDSGPQNR